MSFSEEPRSTCALGGALNLISSIKRAVPIIHAGPGCGFTLTFGQNIANGYQYIGYASGFAAPSTNTLEKHVVFGGESRLREQIRTTLVIMDADIFFVVSGCTAGLIGDDVKSIVAEFQGSEKPVIFSETSGFKGNTSRGYDLALRSLVDQLVLPSEKKTKNLVNLFGVVPSHDAFWQGDINEIVRLLNRIGVEVNLSGNGDDIEKIRRAAEAELNIVLSANTGLSTAELFKEKYQVPYLKYPLPIGTETGKFLRAVAEALDLEKERVETVIREEEAEFWKYLIQFSEAYVFLLVNKEFDVISDSNYAIGLARFLTNDLGLYPKLIAVTDSPDEGLRAEIEGEIKELNYGISPRVIFEEDSYKVWEEISKDVPNLVFGSSLDRQPAKKRNALLFPVSYPLFDQTVLSKGYSGYRGAVRLVEDLGTALLTSI
ncbi:MAG TPA: nitrogenase component 1 [Methanotrichaceae archaeon]|nr:nitrogenase component 1 [Methanotrichaceae archaeon]